MLKFKFEVDRLEYAHKKHVRAFNEKLEELYKQAVRLFMREALSYVPGYTGMSRASFLKLASFLGESIDLQQSAPAKYITSEKNPTLGAQRGQFKFEVTPNGLLKFEFSTRVAQYRINEFIDATKYRHPETGRQYFRLIDPGPYYSLTKGKLVFNRFIRENIPKQLPKISRFISKQRTNLVSASFTEF